MSDTDGKGNTLEIFGRFLNQIGQVDSVTQITIKGHLFLEEKLNEGIETFAFHPELFPDLSFYKKVQLARSLSREYYNDASWEVILAINELRNALAHSLNPERREMKIKAFRAVFGKLFFSAGERSELPDEQVLVAAFTMTLGFLGSFVTAAEGFKQAMVEYTVTDEI